MKKTIEEEKLKFWIFSTLGKNNDFYDACVRRAYRDFNRTLRGIGEIQKKESFDEMVSVVKIEIKKLIETEFENQNSFDSEHEKSCDLIIKNFDELYNNKVIYNDKSQELTYGQAQKWINMSIKYLFLLGENKINEIRLNLQYFHVPIDSIIIKNIEENHQISTFFNKPWSKLDDYGKYLKYQSELRKLAKNKDISPLEFELITFNK